MTSIHQPDALARVQPRSGDRNMAVGVSPRVTSQKDVVALKGRHDRIYFAPLGLNDFWGHVTVGCAHG